MAGYNEGWYRFVRWLVRTFYFGAFTGGMKSVDAHKVPSQGPVIIAPNHVSNLDPPVTACALPHRRLRFLAKEELFKGIFGKIITSLGAFPVKRGEGDTEAIRKSIALLEAGEALLVHPEGTRGDGETLNPINKGVSMLAKRSGAPVVPVGISGTHIVSPKGRKGRRHVITVAYGEPLRLEEFTAKHGEKEGRELFTRELERRIVELCHNNGYPVKTGSSTERPASYPGPETPVEAQDRAGA